ncbi:protein FAM181B [Eudromia elegans]
MAVPAALLSPHQLLSLCFPAGGLLGCGDLPRGYEGGGEAADAREATRDLLRFMDSASSNIKLALDKPGKSKRKVNHRKYLQKQIKRCSGMLAGAEPARARAQPPAPPGTGTGTGAGAGRAAAAPRREAAGAAGSAQSRSLAALFDSLPQAARKVPLRARNLPPSFFTEPAPPAPPPGAREADRGGAEAAELLELLGAEYGALLAEPQPQQDARPPAELPGGLYEAAAAAPPGGLLYGEPWGAGKKAPPAAPPLYCAPGAEEPFAPCFAEGPPGPYGCGYARAAYPGL